MTTLLLAWLLAHGVPGPHAEALAPCVAEYHDPAELLGVIYVESRYRQGKRSHAGACSYFGLLGGRYGNPTCEALEADPALACRVAVAELAYWQRHCGRAYLDAYNGGWWKCWDRAKVKGRRCKGKCDGYAKKVRRHAAWVRMVLDGWETK